MARRRPPWHPNANWRAMDKSWNLGAGERELYASRFSPVSLYLALASGLITIAASLLGAAWLWRFAQGQYAPGPHLPEFLYTVPGILAKWLLPIVALLGVAHIALSLARYAQEYIVLTNHRLLLTSLLGMNDRNIMLTSLRNVNKSRSLLGMMLGYGSIEIQDTSESWIVLRYVPHPDDLAVKISNASGQ